MSVYKSAKSPFYGYDFQLHGHRFHGSTKARNRKDAEAVERQLKAKAKADLEAQRRTGMGPLTLDVAAGRYWKEVGERHSNSGDTLRNLERLLEFFGPSKRLDEITDADLAALVTWRSKQHVTVQRRNAKGELETKPLRPVTPATVNRTAIVPLKAICRRAARTWRCPLPLEPIWKDHWLKEPTERVRELHAHEDEALEAVIRDDFAPWLEFVRLTGLRMSETLLRWENVNWFSKTIVTTGKRGQKVTTPITPEVAAILTPLQEHHPEAVFTYVCRRNKRGRTKEETRIKGQRYPITLEGGKSQWQRFRKAANLHDFRFHDFRHDTATRLMRETGNIKLVQRALNHTSITTTARSAHVSDNDLADALSRAAKAKAETKGKSRKKSRNTARIAA